MVVANLTTTLSTQYQNTLPAVPSQGNAPGAVTSSLNVQRQALFIDEAIQLGKLTFGWTKPHAATEFLLENVGMTPEKHPRSFELISKVFNGTLPHEITIDDDSPLAKVMNEIGHRIEVFKIINTHQSQTHPLHFQDVQSYIGSKLLQEAEAYSRSLASSEKLKSEPEIVALQTGYANVRWASSFTDWLSDDNDVVAFAQEALRFKASLSNEPLTASIRPVKVYKLGEDEYTVGVEYEFKKLADSKFIGNPFVDKCLLFKVVNGDGAQGAKHPHVGRFAVEMDRSMLEFVGPARKVNISKDNLKRFFSGGKSPVLASVGDLITAMESVLKPKRKIDYNSPSIRSEMQNMLEDFLIKGASLGTEKEGLLSSIKKVEKQIEDKQLELNELNETIISQEEELGQITNKLATARSTKAKLQTASQPATQSKRVQPVANQEVKQKTPEEKLREAVAREAALVKESAAKREEIRLLKVKRDEYVAALKQLRGNEPLGAEKKADLSSKLGKLQEKLKKLQDSIQRYEAARSLPTMDISELPIADGGDNSTKQTNIGLPFRALAHPKEYMSDNSIDLLYAGSIIGALENHASVANSNLPRSSSDNLRAFAVLTLFHTSFKKGDFSKKHFDVSLKCSPEDALASILSVQELDKAEAFLTKIHDKPSTADFVKEHLANIKTNLNRIRIIRNAIEGNDNRKIFAFPPVVAQGTAEDHPLHTVQNPESRIAPFWTTLSSSGTQIPRIVFEFRAKGWKINE